MLAEALSGVTIAGLATWAGFQSMWPTSQVYGRTFIGLQRGSPYVALTYDDGPNEPWTLRLLEVLDRHSVKATFFVIGRYVAQTPGIARNIVAAGHAIGLHTWDHSNLIFAGSSEVRRQINETRRAVLDATGIDTNLFRPPFGARRPATLRIVRSAGLEPILWNVTAYDWKPTTAEKVVAHIERQMRGGDVILMHDGGHTAMGADRSHTVKATDRLVAQYKSEGYEFVTIPKMMQKQLEVSKSNKPRPSPEA